ncbi:TenA family protein [Pseudactinotalea terrae]|uniref:TenA family protein n=1 Tax=Pseudactinotalea terrae TaxID=1743262 RepID=UPI0012E228E8|nr:TenA family protein [Pseudactinotalea terrae]
MTSPHTTIPETIRDPDDTGMFTAVAWQRAAPVRWRIEDLSFLTALADGSLPRETFAYYMAQDAHYLADYGRALAACAHHAIDAEELTFWLGSAQRTVRVERELHAAHVGDLAAIEKSPTCTAYTSYLLGLSTSGSYPELAAGVLPCFWVYDDVGTRLKDRVGDLAGHPYGDWIATYGAPGFAATARAARDIVDRLARHADQRTVERMHAAFARAVRYEWMFWDAAYRKETWPV